ncbi:MAG TPA: proton-conducting transporter membrane subunit [Thermomicrobiales bacterium]|jgi:multicomponent Na+:H+ antiporter subunit D|nr:proton-conducting transporter membrane subunit [Thermomicrobiales bacterium]
MIALPIVILWLGGLLLAVVDGTRKPWGWIASAIMAAAVIATIILGIDIYENGVREMAVGGWSMGVGITLRVDMMGIVFAVLSQVVLLVSLMYEVINDVGARIFPALVLFLGLGLTGLVFTGDAFNFYVFFEIAMLSSYVLVSYGETPRQFRAAFVFITVNLLGSVLFLIGIAAIYHTTGFLDMERIRDHMPLVQENPAILTATLIFIAFSVKLGLFPFHFWLPAVYTGTRPAVAAILSGALANIGSYGLLRFGADIFPRELDQASGVLIFLGAASIIYGGHQAVSRHAANEVLAYSAIGQVGYIMIALGIGGPLGWAAAILYAVLNSLNKVLLFLSGSLRGWLAGAAFAVGAFSVSGLPPAGGFLGKMALFQLSVDQGHPELVALIFLGGALSFVYMFQIYRRRISEASEEDTSPVAVQGLLVGLAVLVLVIGVYPEPLLSIVEHASLALPEGLFP